jgi:hypothetical protein
VTIASTALTIAAVLALLLITGAVRRSRRRTRRVRELTDLSRDDIDPEWEQVRKSMTRPGRRPRRLK